MGFNDSNQYSPRVYRRGQSAGSIQIEGVDELIKTLRKHLTVFTDKEVRNMLKGGAQLIVDAAKARCRVNDGGRLRNSIKILPKWSKHPRDMYVGPRVIQRFSAKTSQKRKDANPFYAHFIEYGTDPHNLGFQGKFVSVKGASHPGSRKMPYMRPAYDETRVAAINRMFDDIASALEKRH